MKFGLLNAYGRLGIIHGTSATFWSCITFDSVGTLAAVDGNIDSKKFMKIVDIGLH